MPEFKWFWRPDNVYEQAKSLMLVERKSSFEERSRRMGQVVFGKLNLKPQFASLFYFRLTCEHDLDQPKLEATNRLLRIAPHLGLALLVMLV